MARARWPLLTAYLLTFAAIAGCVSDDPPEAGDTGAADDAAMDAGATDGSASTDTSSEGTSDDASSSSQSSTDTTAENEAPTAAFSYQTPTAGMVPGSTISFDASESTDDRTSPANMAFAWDFGDGSAAGSGITTEHTFAAAGTYTVTLTATDAEGLSDDASTSLTFAIATPTSGIHYNKTFTGGLTIGNPLGGGESNLETATALGLREGIDHAILNLTDIPTTGTKLTITTSWPMAATLPLGTLPDTSNRSLPDLNTYVFLMDGTGGFNTTGATAANPETITLTGADAKHGNYRLVVWFYAGANIEYTTNVLLES